MTLQPFKDRILGRLLPEYCDDPSRGWGCAGFKPEWSKISELDAIDFLRALDANLVRHVGRGQYLAAKSSNKDQFFWEGRENVTPRPIFLWMEAIISVAGLARLHFDYGWPGEVLGTQTSNHAFDLGAFNGCDIMIACEVKKSKSELQELVRLMHRFAADNVLSEQSMVMSRSEINAFRKLMSLRNRRAPIFWALGRGGVEFVFRMIYGESSLVTFHPASDDDLHFGNV